MSFLTCRCDFPQKEQRSCSLESVGRAISFPPTSRSERTAALVLRDHSVDDAVVLCFLGGHEVVALRVLLDLVDGLLRVLGDDLIKPTPHVDDLARVDLDVRR